MKVKTTFKSFYNFFVKVLSLFITFLSISDCFDFRQFCDNRPNVKIDSVVKLDNNSIYVTSGQYYALIQTITEDHLPIIANGYPKVINEEFKELETKYINMSALDYKFVGTQYYLKDRNPNEAKFIGFNQVWMGCPQPLCIQGGIDAILKKENLEDNSLNVIIFRGKYFWEIGNYSEPPLVENAKLIDENWESQELEFPIDAAFTTWNLHEMFFKGNKTFEFGLSYSISYINKTYKGIPNNVNAVMYWDTGTIDKEILFVFKDHRVWALRNNELLDDWPKNITELNHNLPNNINSGLIDYENNVFLFKDSNYYTFKATDLESNTLSNIELMPRIVFKDFFQCNESLYTEWGFGSYQQFLLNYYSNYSNTLTNLTDPEISSSFIDKFQQIFLKSEKSTQINWIVVLIAFATIVSFSLIGVLVLIYCISRFKRRSDESKNIEVLAVMRPLMNETRNHFDIISIEELPKKGKKNNLKLNRTKLSDDAYG